MLLKKSPKIGYLLGAGFSKYFGLPLANEFINTASTIVKENLYRKYGPTRKADIFEKIVGFSEHISAEKNRKINSIEELLELADKRNIALSLNDPWLNIGDDIRKAIFEILCVTQFLIFESPAAYKTLDYYLRFLDLVSKTGSGPILSLNYDCLFEIMLNTAMLSNYALRDKCAAVIRFDYGIGVNFQAINLLQPTVDIRFFKLHGAYNWQICDVHGFQEQSGPLRLNVRGTCNKCGKTTQPYIIYPTKRKQLTTELNDIWAKAFELIKEVNKLVIIGVKFNPADKDLIEKVRQISNHGIELIIIDPNAIELQNLFQKSIPITTENKNGARFEDVFGFKSPKAREEFERCVGTKIRDLNNFQKEKPPRPFFEEPIKF